MGEAILGGDTNDCVHAPPARGPAVRRRGARQESGAG